MALTAERLVRFPELVDRFEGGVYRRLLIVEGSPLLVSIRQAGPPSRAVLHVDLKGKKSDADSARAEARRLVVRALGAAADLSTFPKLMAADPLLGPAAKAFRGLRVAGAPSLWECLVTTVLCQQVNLTFAYSIRSDLVRAFGRRARFDGELFYAFPSPQRVLRDGAEGLGDFRLTRAKVRAILSLAEAFASGKLVDHEIDALDDEQVVERLVALPGIGLWTAEQALLRGLGRMDAFPGGDLGVIKHVAVGLLGRPDGASEAEMRAYAERWRPFRGLALIYCYAELARRSGPS